MQIVPRERRLGKVYSSLNSLKALMLIYKDFALTNLSFPLLSEFFSPIQAGKPETPDKTYL
jgi:hypothetical protein